MSKKTKFLCPVPGYDRHFKLLENFGIEMIAIPFQDDGPDVNVISDLISKDDDISGIVCVPRHSNPTGHVYSDQNVKEIFELIANKKRNFMVLWDNAYACHDFRDTINQTPVMKLADEYELKDNLFIVGSTSKITLAGSGLAFFASSELNISKFIEYRNSLTPGPNKLNQGMHVNYFKKSSLQSQMESLKEVILPKFELVEKYLDELKKGGFCDYIQPSGGYFISYESSNSNAEQIIEHCSKLGLKLLPIGSCFPYQKDPKNSNIRIAPTFPNLENLERCMEIFSKVVKKLN